MTNRPWLPSASRSTPKSKSYCLNPVSLTDWIQKSEIQEAISPSRPPNWFNFWPAGQPNAKALGHFQKPHAYFPDDGSFREKLRLNQSHLREAKL
jgi:hypothetical protein